ncbi:HEPN domain-containing protein [Tissierella creatinini]|nr:HEPN domain-containing protein [Tissierella creatinini]TJX60677.1 HEPN domain-containing protein [Soehngenia saccharolytica]
MDKFIAKGKLKQVNITSDMVLKELEVGKRDLEAAKQSLNNENYKWSTIQAYYAIFHAIGSLIFAKGYREESHVALKVAFKELYIDTEILDDSILKTLQRGMDLREMADYKETFSKNSAEIIIESVTNAIIVIEDYIKKQ